MNNNSASLPRREEIREHNVLFVSAQQDVSRRKGSSMTLPPVIVESRETREDRKRRSKRAFCRKYGLSLCMIVGLLLLMEKLDEWFSLEHWVEVHPVSIQRDYSTVQGVEDLATDHVDRWCHVSLLYLCFFFFGHVCWCSHNTSLWPVPLYTIIRQVVLPVPVKTRW